MESIFLIGGIVLLLLFLFNKNESATRGNDPYDGFFPGGQSPQGNRVTKKEQHGPFTSVAYAILFVLTLFGFMQMSNTSEFSYSKSTDFKYDSSEDYDRFDEREKDDEDVVVIRP